MIRFIPLIVFLLVTITSFAQIEFEKGYYVNNAGQRIDCFIKNVDWLNTPNKFYTKSLITTEPQLASIDTVAEFGIGNLVKYKRFVVEIDYGSDEYDKLTYNRNPMFTTDTLFLQVLVEGSANLYKYNKRNLLRYFFSDSRKDLQQLINRKFRNEFNTVKINEQYKQQLLNAFNNGSIKEEQVKKLKYNDTQLINIFNLYNNTVQSESFTYQKNNNNGNFSISLFAGGRTSSLSIRGMAPGPVRKDYATQMGFNFGFSLETILPFNKNKWALILEPYYQQYSFSKEVKIEDAKIEYKSLSVPVGVKHYFYLNEKDRVYMKALFLMDIPIESSILVINYVNQKIGKNTTLVFALGYNRSKLSFEGRFDIGRDILTDSNIWNARYTTFSLQTSYRLN